MPIRRSFQLQDVNHYDASLYWFVGIPCIDHPTRTNGLPWCYKYDFEPFCQQTNLQIRARWFKITMAIYCAKDIQAWLLPLRIFDRIVDAYPRYFLTQKKSVWERVSVLFFCTAVTVSQFIHLWNPRGMLSTDVAFSFNERIIRFQAACSYNYLQMLSP